LSEFNPYEAYSNAYREYTEGSVFSESPLSLVVALYRRAIEATSQAIECVAARDIPGRTKAINKAFAILTELLLSLDHEKGGEISQTLKPLYCYLQGRLIEAHGKQAAAPLAEVKRLLETLLEGWSGALAQSKMAQSVVPPVCGLPEKRTDELAAGLFPYGGYLDEPAEMHSSTAYSF
jgi:flagellar secretion chaperone FliS